MTKVLPFYAHFLNQRTVIELKFPIFIVSYLMGAAVMLFNADHLLPYLLLLFLYLALTDYFAPQFHRVLVIDPLILSYSSVLLFSLLENRGDMVFVQYVLVVFFLLGYHQLRGKWVKNQYETEEVTVHFYVKRLLLPIVYPVAFYFAIHFFVQQQISLSFYWMFYFLVVIYFTKYIQTSFYFGYYAITQVLVLAYLFQFMEGMLLAEKIMIYLFVLATATGRYVYTRSLGGEKHVSFIQAFLRKNLQKPEDRSRLRERR